jgi:hypothetical protein
LSRPRPPDIGGPLATIVACATVTATPAIAGAGTGAVLGRMGRIVIFVLRKQKLLLMTIVDIIFIMTAGAGSTGAAVSAAVSAATAMGAGAASVQGDALPFCSSLADRKCAFGDTDCGKWVGHSFRPHNCMWRDISPFDARKCVGNRTLAFIGDSQIRDIATGVGLFLAGQIPAEATVDKFDKISAELGNFSSKIAHFDSWKVNVGDHNGMYYPAPSVATEKGWEWQVQAWMLYSHDELLPIEEGYPNNPHLVLSGQMAGLKENPYLRKVDFAFWCHGLHDSGWWDQPPYGLNYYNNIVQHWQHVMEKEDVAPSVYVSMNPECKWKLKGGHTFISSPRHTDVQYNMVENATLYMNSIMREKRLPYWDAASVLRTEKRCDHTPDGVHSRGYVNVFRAKMLFSFLCDEEMRWRDKAEEAFL